MGRQQDELRRTTPDRGQSGAPDGLGGRVGNAARRLPRHRSLRQASKPLLTSDAFRRWGARSVKPIPNGIRWNGLGPRRASTPSPFIGGGSGRGGGGRASAWVAASLIRPAATFSAPPRKGETARRGRAAAGAARTTETPPEVPRRVCGRPLPDRQASGPTRPRAVGASISGCP